MEEETNRPSDHHHISFTAYLVSYWRSLSDIPFASDISNELEAERVSREFLGSDLEQTCWFGAPMVESRNKALRREINRTGVKNIYGIGDGALPTGVLMTTDPKVKYLHTDLPGMLSEAEVVLRNLMVDRSLRRPNLRFMSVDAMDKAQLQAGADYFSGEQFVLSCEGFFIYMNDQERPIVADEFHGLLKRNNGIAWVTSDINYKTNFIQLVDIFGKKYQDMMRGVLQKVASRTQGRNIRENFFDTPEHAHKFLDEHRFDFERMPFYDGSFELTSLKHVPQEYHEGIIKMFSERFIYVLRPR